MLTCGFCFPTRIDLVSAYVSYYRPLTDGGGRLTVSGVVRDIALIKDV